MSFTPQITSWYRKNKRNLPWRHADNPYVIWIAEVVFQQTRIEQGLPFFTKFLEKFPSINHLANAKTEEVLKKWQGLGYYSRARNLHFSAQFIVNELGGEFPSNYKDLLKLKGVGPYIAAEVASVCFNEPVAAVDGNVQRVISRVFNIAEAVNSPSGDKIVRAFSQEHLDVSNPGDYNQAVMELGALICTPKNPNCEQCPVADVCVANQKGIQESLPVKLKKVKVRKRYFNYFLHMVNGRLAMRQRPPGDVWQGLFEPVLEEVEKMEELDNTLIYQEQRVLSHQKIEMRFFDCNRPKAKLDDAYKWYSLKEIYELPVPKSVENLFASAAFKEFINTFV